MKLGSAARIILIVGIFAVALFMLYRMNSQQEQEQEQLDVELSGIQLLLPKLMSDKGDLESQLAQLQGELTEATASLSEAKANFPPEPAESIEYDELLFKMAHDRRLEVMSLTATEPSDQNVEGVTYTVTSFDICVEAEAVEQVFDTEEEYKAFISQGIVDILDFIHAIATGEDFTTATVEPVTISVPEPLLEEETEEAEEEIEELTEEEVEEAEAPSATIRLVIYSYKGE